MRRRLKRYRKDYKGGDKVTDNENEERMFQCEFNMEDTGAPAGKEGIYSAPYVCAVCGAGAHSAENLCAPENNQNYEPSPH